MTTPIIDNSDAAACKSHDFSDEEKEKARYLPRLLSQIYRLNDPDLGPKIIPYKFNDPPIKPQATDTINTASEVLGCCDANLISMTPTETLFSLGTSHLLEMPIYLI